MEEKNLWADVFEAIRAVESAESNLRDALESRDKEIYVLYKNSVPKAQIARRIGLSRPTIDKIIDKQEMD